MDHRLKQTSNLMVKTRLMFRIDPVSFNKVSDSQSKCNITIIHSRRRRVTGRLQALGPFPAQV